MGRLIIMDHSPKFLLRYHFNSYDANCDGLLSKEDLKKAFRDLGSLTPSFHADRALHHADANMDGYVNHDEMDELVKYAARCEFTIEGAQPFRSVMPRRGGHDKYYGDSFTKADADNANGDRSSSVMPRRGGHDKYYGDSFTKADANNANGDRSSSVMPRRDDHDKYYGDSFTKADPNNANGDSSIQAIINANADSSIEDSSIQAIINANADSSIQANNANGDGLKLNINADAIEERFIHEEEIYEEEIYAARYGFTPSFGFLTKEQLKEKFKQCDFNNDSQLSRAELKKRFQNFNNEKLNKLVEDAPVLGYTVELCP